MENKRRKVYAGICVVVFLIFLIAITAGISSFTITYHINSGGTEKYEKTYNLFFGNQMVKLDVPELAADSSDTVSYSGWYFDEELCNKAPDSLELTGNIDLYAGWMENDPNTIFELPEIYITSETDFDDIERYEYNSCTYTITNTTVNHCLESVGGQIKGRGNSTWNEFEKKSYRMKFEDKQNLFHMGEDKDWALLSNSVDYSLLRNEIALKLGDIYDVYYTSQCQWVQLFYNGEYQGLYLLCEVVETGIHRVDIEEAYEPEAVDVPFFLELGGELDGFSLDPVETAEDNWGDYFSCQVVYPGGTAISQHQYEYIYAYMQLVNAAILNKDWEEITELVDVESFANWYLANEIMFNGDMGWSMFAYKTMGGKLCLGPLWDFDQSCGNSNTGGEDYETWYPDTSSQNTWFNTLMEMNEFREVIKKRWREEFTELNDYLDTMQEKPKLYSADIAANYERWPVIGTAPWRIREEIGALKTYQENVDFLFEWLDSRITWIDKEVEQME